MEIIENGMAFHWTFQSRVLVGTNNGSNLKMSARVIFDGIWPKISPLLWNKLRQKWILRKLVSREGPFNYNPIFLKLIPPNSSHWWTKRRQTNKMMASPRKKQIRLRKWWNLWTMKRKTTIKMINRCTCPWRRKRPKCWGQRGKWHFQPDCSCPSSAAWLAQLFSAFVAAQCADAFAIHEKWPIPKGKLHEEKYGKLARNEWSRCLLFYIPKFA